jgi:hypothetical protein
MAHRYQVEYFEAILQKKLVFSLGKRHRFDKAAQGSQHVLTFFLVVVQLSRRLFLHFADIWVLQGSHADLDCWPSLGFGLFFVLLAVDCLE